MKLQWIGVVTLTTTAMAAVALAHTGATGVVLERMNGMTALRDTVAELAPMMQGTVPYDAVIVSEGASVMSGHAGDMMLSLFPEGSLEGVTYAKPEIWSDWQEFAALAEELKTYADALTVAAPNGLEPAPPPGDMAGMDHSGMAMAPDAEADPGFTVAELMGYGGEKAPENLVARGTSEPATLAIDLTTLAADDLFTRISATCSSCHSQFRAGRD